VSRHSSLLASALLLLAVALANPGCRTGDAARAPQWIWRDHDLRHVQAVAFYVVRELDLDRIDGPAIARVQADEEYVLLLNGSRIGSGRRGPEAGGEEYDVTRWLHPGKNRFVAEVRSSTGAGGFWFELRDASGPLARSDGDWTIYRGEWRGLFRGGTLLPGEPPLVLGASPVGRWPVATHFRRMEPFEAELAAPEPVPAVARRTWGSAEDWTPILERQRRPASFGPLVEIDFGGPRAGFLQLAFRDSATRNDLPALVFFSLEPLAAPPIDSDVVFRPIPGRNLFQDTTPRQFRYVAVAGLTGLFSAEVLAIRPEAFDAFAKAEAARGRPRGVFGVEPPPRLRSPVEHKVWRELERTAGFALRKSR
jgi:hypothetical protein